VCPLCVGLVFVVVVAVEIVFTFKPRFLFYFLYAFVMCVFSCTPLCVCKQTVAYKYILRIFCLFYPSLPDLVP